MARTRNLALHDNQLMAQHGDPNIVVLGLWPDAQRAQDTPQDQETHGEPDRAPSPHAPSWLFTAMILRVHPTPQTLRPRMAEAQSEVERGDGSLSDGTRSLRQRTPCPGSSATQHLIGVPSLPQFSGSGDRGPCVVEHERHELDDRRVNRVESTTATSRHRVPDQPRTDSRLFGRRTKACRQTPPTTKVGWSPWPRGRHDLCSGRAQTRGYV